MFPTIKGRYYQPQTESEKAIKLLEMIETNHGKEFLKPEFTILSLILVDQS